MKSVTSLSHYFRVIISIFLLYLWSGVLLIGIPLIGAVSLLTSSERVKQVVEDSGVYESAGPLILKYVNETSAQESQFISQLQERLGDSEDPLAQYFDRFTDKELLQSNADIAIDGIYAFLEGESDSPQFQLQLFEGEDDALGLMEVMLQERLGNLPVCNGNVSSEPVNPFEAECLPQDFSVSQISEFFQSEEDNPQLQKLLDQFVDGNIEVEVDRTDSANLQKAYNRVRLFPFVVLLVLGVIGSLILLISVKRKLFLFLLAINTVAASLIVAAVSFIWTQVGSPLLTDFLITQLNQRIPTEFLSSEVAQLISRIVEAIFINVNREVLSVAGIFAIGGILMSALLAGVWLIRRRKA